MSDMEKEVGVDEVLSNEIGVSQTIVSRVLSTSDDARELFQRLSKHIVDEKAAREKLNANITSLRRARVNADQQFNQLEKQLISCNSKLEHELKSNETIKQRLDDTANELEVKSKKLFEVESIKENAATNYTHVSHLKENLEAEKLNLIASVERKNKEIERLNGEWESMHEKVNAANSLQCEAKAKLHEFQSKETSYQLRENRLEQEKNLLKTSNEWLDAQLKEKSELLFEIQKDKSSNVHLMKNELNAKNDEIKNLETLTQSLKANNEELKTQVDSFMEKVKDARELQVKTEEQYKREVASQSKLSNLYKDSAEQSDKKCSELLSAVEELQHLLKAASNERVEAEGKLKESEANCLNTVKEYDEKLENLHNELKNANDLLEAARQRGIAPMSAESLAALSPTAAVTSAFLKSGMTLTQIYNQYVKTLDSLHVEKAENGRLKEYFDEILKDIEEKAPLLQQQRKDYESALDTVDKLTQKLESAMVECEKFSLEASEAVNNSELLKRENERIKILTADLGNQVKVLLKECEETRGGIVSREYSTMSSDEVSSSSEVISKHLVTFRNIEELQEQNQKLLTVVRKLSDDKENEEEMNTSKTGHIELKSQLDAALSELNELKSARARQVQMVEAVVRQRDMYRVLLSNTGQSPIASQLLEGNISTSPISSKFQEQSNENSEALKELQRQYESYKNERLENEKLLREKNDELQSTMAELNIKNATISSQLEHSNERYKLLDSSCGAFKRESEALREKSHKLSMSSAKLETSLETTRQELSEMKEKLQKIEVMYENKQQERNILKEAEVRLMEENKSLISQQKGQNVLLTNLQTIQNNVERQEYETRTRLTGYNEGLEREITVLKHKLNSDAEHHATVVDSLETQVKELKYQLETEINSHQVTTKNLLDLRKELEKVKTKFSEQGSHLSASETKLNEVLSRDAAEDRDCVLSGKLREQEKSHLTMVDEFKENLLEKESRNKILENQINAANQHLDQYKAMLAANEEQLSELNKTSKLYQEKMEKEQTESRERLVRLERDITSIKGRSVEYEKENSLLKRKLAEDTSNLGKQVNVLNAELKISLKKTETCIINEKRAKEISERQKLLVAEAQEKYEKELVNHATDVQALTEVKQQLETYNARIAETEEKLTAAVTTLEESQTSWEEQKKITANELEKLMSRCGELVNQNSLLHDQGEKLSQQVISVQSRSASDIHTPSSSEDQESDNVGDLWEVIRFTRKEKEIAATKSEMVQSESVRYQQRLAYVEKQLKETELSLEKERTKCKMSTKDSKEHEEIMEKVERFQEIVEVNKVLTSEKESLKRKIGNIESQVKKLESDLNPLKENIVSLTSQKDMLVGEKTALKSEIQRWKSRANQLIEQCKQQPDPEDFKKLQEEKKQLLGQQKSSKDEAQKSKVQVEAMRNEISRLQAEIYIKKTETAKMQEEVNSLKSDTTSSKLQEEVGNLQKEVESKTEDANEKVKTITQLKKIARRYKSQCDDLTKEKEELNKKLAEEKPANTESTKEHENAMKILNEEKKALQDEVEKLTQLSTASKEKDEKSKKTLNSATKRIQQLMGFKDKCSNENEELKKSLEEVRQEKDAMVQAANEREMRLTVLSTQFEGKHLRMEKELKGKSEELEKFTKEKIKLQEREISKESENDKLKKRNQQFQRLLLQAQQKLKSQATLLAAAQSQLASSAASGSGVSGTENLSKEMVISPSPSVVPPTAAVKPTSTPSTSSPVRLISTPTASIRPMAMTTAVQPTPTATVPPTVTTQPTAVVSAVSESITVTSVPFRSQSSTSTTTVVAAITPSVLPSVSSEVTSSPSVSVRPITSSPIIAMATSSMEVSEERPPDIVVSGEERPSASEVSPGQAIVEQSVITDSQALTGSKRTRAGQESSQDRNAKKSRTELEERHMAGDDSVDEEEVLGEVNTGDEDDDDDDDGIIVSEDQEKSGIEEEHEIVCIDDESDDDEVTDEGIEREIEEEEDEDDDDDDIVEVIDDDMDIKEEFGDEGMNDESEGSGRQEISNNVVVRVTADSTPSTSGQQEQRRQDDAVMTSQALRLVRSQSHLAPFTLAQGQSSNSGFDDADDCMVPSTPTLFIPKRSDGFSEMISSPRVHHPFLFGPSAESNLNQTGGLAMGMSEEGLRVDDTRFDIMASTGDDVDMGFDNVVPDLDEAVTIEFQPEDEGGESSSVLSSVVSSTSGEQNQTVDFSEQNVPETSEEHVVIEIDEEKSGVDDRTQKVKKDDEGEPKLELTGEEVRNEDAALETRQTEEEPLAEPLKDASGEETSSRSTTVHTTQEGRSKSSVVQLRRPAVTSAQHSTAQLPRMPATTSGVQAIANRRIIRRVQARGRGNQRRGRGGQRSTAP